MPKPITSSEELRAIASRNIITKELICKLRTDFKEKEDPDLEIHLLTEDRADTVMNLFLYQNLGKHLLTEDDCIDADKIKTLLESNGYVFSRKFKDIYEIVSPRGHTYKQGNEGIIGHKEDDQVIIMTFFDGPIGGIPREIICSDKALDILCNNIEQIKF